MKHWFSVTCLLWSSFVLSQRAAMKDGNEAMLREDKTWVPSGSYPDFAHASSLEAIIDHQVHVLLLKDHSWKYADPKTEAHFEKIPVSRENFEKKSTASSLVKSKIVYGGIYFDPEKWIITTEQHEQGANEYLLRSLFNQEIQGSFGSYRVNNSETTIEKAKNTVVSVFLKSPEISVRKKEFRKVNGTDMFYIRFYETETGYEVIQNHFVTDDGYYVVTEAAAPEKIFNQHEAAMEELINGGIKIKTEKLRYNNTAAPVPPPVIPEN